jgi:hypothetical protein
LCDSTRAAAAMSDWRGAHGTPIIAMERAS